MESFVIAAFAFAGIALIVALIALIFLAKLSIAQGRFDTDAQQRAVHLQRYIDQQVERRVVYGRHAYTGPPVTSGKPATGDLPLPDQPPANVQARGRVDDVHEREREEARLRGEEHDYDVRDTYDEQPMIET